METSPKSRVARLVEEIVKALVDHEEMVYVLEVEEERSVILKLMVHPDDVTKVIGRKGVHIDALRRIIHAVVQKEGKRYILEILGG